LETALIIRLVPALSASLAVFLTFACPSDHNRGDGKELAAVECASDNWGPQVNVSNNTGRSTTYFGPIRILGNRLHLVYSNGRSPASGPGYEDVYY
jgi:hypothetical protein